MVIFILDIILLVPVILLQSGSGAQSGMFGSDLTMGAFGAKTSEVLVNFTKWLVGIFFVCAFVMGYIKVKEYNNYVRQREQTQETQEQQGSEAITNSGTNSMSNILTNQGPGSNR